MTYRPSAPYLYLPDGWDTGWKEAKANCASSPRGVLFLGDSVTEGGNTTNFLTQSFPALLRSTLAGLYGAYGDYYAACYDPALMPGNGAGYFAAGANGGFFTTLNFGRGVLNNAAVAFGTTGDVAYTTPYACTAVDLVCWDAGGARTWQYNVDTTDGTGLTTVTTLNATNNHYRIALSGLPNQIHTIRAGNGNAGAAMCIDGAISYTGTSGGLLYAFQGMSAVKAGDLAAGATTWQGFYKTGAGGSTTHQTGFGWPCAPSLAVIELGINDMAGNYSDLGFRRVITMLIDAMRYGSQTSGWPQTSIVLVGAYVAPPESTDATTTFTNAYRWPAYLAMMKDLATQHNCALLNMNARWGLSPVAQGFMGTGNAHPNVAGYADMATAIQAIL